MQSRGFSRSIFVLSLTALFVFVSLPSSAQNIIYVDVSASGSEDGTTWQNAFQWLYDAIASAQSGDQIWIAEGTYPVDKSNIFSIEDDTSVSYEIPSGVTVRGCFNGSEELVDERTGHPSSTILTGDLTDDASDPDTLHSDHVVSLESVNSVVLDCLTVTGGNHPGDLSGNGGGIRSNFSNVSLIHVHITNSYAENGGCFYFNGGFADISASKIVDCGAEYGGGMFTTGGFVVADDVVVENNEANQNGGGVYNDIANNYTVSNARFNLNTATSGGGLYNNALFQGTGVTFGYNVALTGSGGAIHNTDAIILFDAYSVGNRAELGNGGGLNMESGFGFAANTGFYGNVAAQNGGAIYNPNPDANLVLDMSYYGRNQAGEGGAIYNQGDLDIQNPVFSTNFATFGGAFLNNGLTTLRNATFWNNNATDSGADIGQAGDSLRILNSVLQDGPDTQTESITLDTGAQAVILANSILTASPLDTIDLGGNQTGSVTFHDADGEDDISGTFDDDLRLQIGSIGIDQADLIWLKPDELDFDGDGDFQESFPLDARDQDRVQDDNPDVGAFEGQTATTFQSGVRFSADLSVEKTVEVVSETYFIYTISVTNDGPQTTAGVEVADILPSELGISAISTVGVLRDDPPVWEAGRVAVGDTVTFVLEAFADMPGIYTNEACITASHLPDPDDFFNGFTGPAERNDCSTVTVGDPTSVEPENRYSLRVLANYPNPFSTSTTLVVETPRALQEVTIELIDILGRSVLQKDLGSIGPGENAVELDGIRLPDGLYLYRLHAGGSVARGSLIVNR